MSRPVLATARWYPLHGDPAATERGRWFADSPTDGCLGRLDAGPDDAGRVVTLLRELLAAEYEEPIVVESVTVEYREPWAVDGGAVVTAYGPPLVVDEHFDSQPSDAAETSSGAALTAEGGERS